MVIRRTVEIPGLTVLSADKRERPYYFRESGTRLRASQ